MDGVRREEQIDKGGGRCQKKSKCCACVCARCHRDVNQSQNISAHIRLLTVQETCFVHTSHTELQAHHAHNDERRSVDDTDFGKTRLRASSI